MAQTTFDFEKPLADLEEALTKARDGYGRLAEKKRSTEAKALAKRLEAERKTQSLAAGERDPLEETNPGLVRDQALGETAASPAPAARAPEPTANPDAGTAPPPTSSAIRAPEEDDVDPKLARKIADLEAEIETKRSEIYSRLTPWQRVQIARHPARPHSLDYVWRLFSDWTELRGDRTFADDQAVVTGLARFGDQPVAVIGQQKGADTRDNITRNFGMMHPEGYRKAMRVMKLAEKFSMPVICFIDTPGAYPGIGAEERGQGEAIGRNIMEMSMLRTPVVCVVIGEGASGGALGMGIGDKLLMMQYAWYCVISPEGCASILWRDAAKAPEAAEALKLTAEDLLRLGVVDEIVPEPLGGAHHDPAAATDMLRDCLTRHLDELRSLGERELLDRRFQKYRRMGEAHLADRGA